jgi:small-conductance mechanosensitive channel
MDRTALSQKLEQAVATLRQWVDANVMDQAAAIQFGVIVGTYLLAIIIAPRLRPGIDRLAGLLSGYPRLSTLCRSASAALSWTIWLLFLLVAMLFSETLGIRDWMLELAASLIAAWIVVRLISGFISNALWSCVVGVTVWGLAALNILDLVEPTAALLDSFSITFGKVRLSALGVIKGAFVLTALLWLAILVTDMLERQIRKSRSLTPSIQVLFVKFLKVILIAVAIAAGINSIGIDLTALAVFTGALGVGIGFGLQKVVSNLISGIILLLDRSIKPGDVITVGTTFGWVDKMGSRYTSLLTRDGIEHLVPNEDLITQRVENWSYSNNKVRISVLFGVHYNSDVKKARELALEAAHESDRVIQDEPIVCSMTEFGDSSVNFRLRFWINDPQNGTGNVRGDILMRLWDKLHEHDIEIPYPQRDLHLRSSEPLTIRLQRNASDSGAEGN